LNPWNLDALEEMERETSKKVFTILQLRHHPVIIALKEKLDKAKSQRKASVDLSYITSRGNWYQHSWKGDTAKSGGIATNIGIHFFDMLLWLFGGVQDVEVSSLGSTSASGRLELERANVSWRLSIDNADLPENVKSSGGRAFRSLQVDGEEVDFSDGFTGLHTLSYDAILSGKGFGIAHARPSIELVHRIRKASPS
jgi:UDP-N-acetyl-2-amino-2-deoxyglucuronate dehydrogenase